MPLPPYPTRFSVEFESLYGHLSKNGIYIKRVYFSSQSFSCDECSSRMRKEVYYDIALASIGRNDAFDSFQRFLYLSVVAPCFLVT